MKPIVVRVFTFLRLIDSDHNLSITNITTMAVSAAIIYKVFTANNPVVDVGSLFGVVLNYLGKKYINS